MPKHLARLSLVAVAMAFSATARAQTTNMSTTATVVTPLTVAKITDLAFGTVYPGLAKVISSTVTPNLMGQFTVTGYSGATVYISFTLPTTRMVSASWMLTSKSSVLSM